MTETLGDRIRLRREQLNGQADTIADAAKEAAQLWAKNYTDNIKTAVQNYVDNQITAAKLVAKNYTDAKIAAAIAKLADDNSLINNS